MATAAQSLHGSIPSPWSTPAARRLKAPGGNPAFRFADLLQQDGCASITGWGGAFSGPVGRLPACDGSRIFNPEVV